MHCDPATRRCALTPALAGALLMVAVVAVEAAPSAGERVIRALGVNGGLCVQVGAEDVEGAANLAASGRYLIHALDADEQVVDRAREALQATGRYGLVSADRLPGQGKLPYTEDIVNLLFVAPQESAQVSLAEAHRVMCPGGVLVTGSRKATQEKLEAAGFADVRRLGDSGEWLVAKKPWPAEMDEWTHPRHSAAGNPASDDSLVAPPRRVRWVAGAQAEVRGMVTTSGRNFYGGVLARDGFNGLRLWHRDLIASSSDGFAMKNLGARAAPVAAGQKLFVVEQKKLLALDAASGDVVQEYPAAGEPEDVLIDRGLLIAVTADSVRALYADSAELKWSFAASDPRYVVAGDDAVALVHGQPRRSEPIEAVAIDRETGQARWKRSDMPWLPKVARTVYHDGSVAFEVSSLNDDGPGNALHLVSATTGEVQLDYSFLPGMNHRRQARAMFTRGQLWLLHGGKDENKKRLPIEVSAIDVATGKTLVTHPAGLAHCFPPVMTCRYMISGEFDLTDLDTGEVDAHQITKAACGPDAGWVPANGLIYVTPKHCVCWPMLRGYTAVAPERPAGGIAKLDVEQMEFPLETGAAAPSDAAPADPSSDWPMYRHDPWRSGSTPAEVPDKLAKLWSVELGAVPSGIITQDWRENGFVKGPITSPVVAGGRVVVARPDAHEVVALDADSGAVAWRFTADGRVDTPPTLYKGLCLFGSKNGCVYCLRGDDGRLVWRLRAAPVDERIVAYGQLESPWPVPGSVLVIDDVAYFAAGRQSLADGGILIFAVDPASGNCAWVRRLDSVPQQGFYECTALEFDNFDLLHREGDGVGMSRWVFDRKTGAMSLDRYAAFARLNTGGGSVMAPRGCWSYAPRHQRRIPSYTPLRPLAVYRDNVLFGCLQGASTVYRRDFDLEGGEPFDTKWMTGWAASALSRKGEMPWRSHRLAEKAAWKVDPLGEAKDAPPIHALVLAGSKLLVVGGDGALRVISTADGRLLAGQTLPEPLWDGAAVAQGRLYYATRGGQLVCFGEGEGGR